MRLNKFTYLSYSFFSRIIFLTFYLSCFISASSQSDPKQLRTDSLKAKFQKDSAHTYRFKKVRPTIGIDQRNSWIKNERSDKRIPVSINGFQAGIILYEKHTIGIGLYNISEGSKKAVKLTDNNNVIRYEELYIRYATLYYEYVIFDTRFFEMHMPIELGLGKYVYNLKDESRSQLLWQEQGPARISGGGIEIILKPLKWVGVSGLAGYRFAALNKKTNLNLNGFYYAYGVWIDLRQVYRDIKFFGFQRPKYRKKVKAILGSEG
jgi:hypothetical protein